MASKKSKKNLSPNTKRYIFIIIFLFLGFATLTVDKTTIFGEILIRLLIPVFGIFYQWIFAPVLILFAIFMIKDSSIKFDFFKFFGFFIYFISLICLIGFFKNDYDSYLNIFSLANDFLGTPMSLGIFFILFLVSLVIIFNFSPVNFLNHIFKIPGKIGEIKETFVGEGIKLPTKKERKENYRELKLKDKHEEEKRKLQEEIEKLKNEKNNKQTRIDFEKKPDEKPKKIEIERQGLFSKKTEEEKVEPKKEIKIGKWTLPSLKLLKDPVVQDRADTNEIKQKQLEIQEKLLQFKIEVEMKDYLIGPTVIQYRLIPKEGVKLQKIVNLKDDLALALHAKSIRIQAPIPGIGLVGIEVPNPKRESVFLKEVLTSKEFNNPKLEVPISLGRSVSGNIIVGDLTKMPHLLVAGQTASGKSVGVNGFILSMLYKFSPSDLKFLMIDPKRVELSIYNGIPHLLTPVATTADKALNILKWSVAEMLRRYEIASKINAKNLIEYNNKVSEDEKFHYLIIVIDELADLMMSGDKKEIEDAIIRVAQMGRAVGMHLIIATQRPSVNVLTGLIKANIPSRVSFTVASGVDSRTILDTTGAEDLLGRGDMLYFPTGTTEPERVQGVFVETSEIENIVNELKLTIDPDMLKNLQNLEIANGKSKFEGSIMANYEGNQDEDPEIIEQAVQIIRESKKGSTSLLQRKLGLGYARAAKILDILEDLGYVGPSNGSKPREVYID